MKKNRKTILVIVVVIAILLVAIVGATFAYFSAVITERNKTETRLHSADLGIEFDTTQEIDATGIEPGWVTDKVFTVENTSDYTMSYDINFTKVVNNFTRTSDLVAIGSAEFIDDDHLNDTVEMIGLNDTNIGSSTKVPFALPNENSYTLPVDGSVNTSTTPPTITRGSQVFKVARVLIPAHSKQEFTITFSYIYLGPAVGYTLGDPNDPNNQNVDKGKTFKTTIEIATNGIDSGEEEAGETDPNDGDPADAWKPTNYSFPYQDPTSDYASLERPVFLASDASGNKGVCIMKDEKKYCFVHNNEPYEKNHVQLVFSDGTCTVDEPGDVATWCNTDDFMCAVYHDGIGGIWCRYEPAGMSCSVSFDGHEECYY